MESTMNVVTGEYQHSLDNKGRVFIPAKIRENIGETFYLTISMDKCLCGYSLENWEALCDKVNKMSFVNQRKIRPLFAFAARCDLDSQGRVLIPQNLRDFAGLVKNVSVIGCNNHIELWNSESWNEINRIETMPENIAMVMEELDF